MRQLLRRFGLVIPLGLSLTACTLAPSGKARALPMDASEILYAHNAVRAEVGLLPLQWSSELAHYAQSWAYTLATRNRCRMSHRSAKGQNTKGYGENIYWASPTRWSDGRVELQVVSASEVAYDWASEREVYHYPSNRCQPGKQCGHYTQMVWRDTQKVGCGAALCPDKGQIWVCNYDPPGNWRGERPY